MLVGSAESSGTCEQLQTRLIENGITKIRQTFGVSALADMTEMFVILVNTCVCVDSYIEI